MKSQAIKEAFLAYFQKKADHKIMPSASLVPAGDPSLLFTNAGMVPFKSYFIGQKKSSNPMLASAQRCLRVGGKHNDLENVGHTARHLTFFEMLGNFSFGAYAKKEAMLYAWNFLTKHLGISTEKLWVTVYTEDDEAALLWEKEVGVAKERILRCGEEDNFWSMGDQGPCGPCSEIFYDYGPEVSGGLPGTVDADGDRYVEIWNLVFMQYEKHNDGEMTDLPHMCIDTGMGLERISAVMQNVQSCFEIDSFQGIIKVIQAYHKDDGKVLSELSAKVIADHLRAAVWLIHDQVRPSNEGRGYVLRRLLRRALRFAYTEKMQLPCLYRFIDVVVASFNDQGLLNILPQIVSTVRHEEESFAQTLSQGMQMLEKSLAVTAHTLPGDTMFKLYDTYGFPLDVLEDTAKPLELNLDYEGYEACMQAQKARSKAKQKFTHSDDHAWVEGLESVFKGYSDMTLKSSVLGLRGLDKSPRSKIEEGEEAFVVLASTPFYAESGGQVGDKGRIVCESGVFEVQDTQKVGACIVHKGVMQKGALEGQSTVQAEVATERLDIARNHSACHLLHAALKQVLGAHVVQKGSLVEASRLRFDFSHTQQISKAQWCAIERAVADAIVKNDAVTTVLMPIADAIKQGAEALFTEKYEEEVRVVGMGSFSKELCGGTHVARTGDIGPFVLTVESAVAQGVRRLEAKTGRYALEHIQTLRAELWEGANILKTSPGKILEKLEVQKQHLQELKEQSDTWKVKSIEAEVVGMGGLSVALPGGNAGLLLTRIARSYEKSLRLFIDTAGRFYPEKLAVFVQEVQGEGTNVVVGVPKSLQTTYDAKKVFGLLSERYGGRGGGKSAFAQGVLVGALEESEMLSDMRAFLQKALQA